MPLNPQQLAQLMEAQCKSKQMFGVSITPFCQAFSSGLVTYFKSSNKVTTSDIGVLTVGSGTGKLIGITPPPMLALARANLAAKNIKGDQVNDFAQAIITAIVTHFLAVSLVKTEHTMVALGTGIGKVSGLVPDQMTSQIVSQMKAKRISGDQIKPFVSCISDAFCKTMLSTAIIQVVITGVPSPVTPAGPIPSVGVGTGQVI